MQVRRYTEDEISQIWTNAYFDAIACGYSDEFATKWAHDKVARLPRK
jgi:hypothetical protein